MFYKFEYALRFNLGDEIDDIAPRFLQAIDRARAVAHAVFAEANELAAIISYYDNKRRTRQFFNSREVLKRLGFRYDLGIPERIPQQDARHIEAFGEDLYQYWHTARFSYDSNAIDALLWTCVSNESPVEPTPGGLQTIHIVDFERKIALWIYDDRGMDLIAMEKTALQPYYQQFNPWLLDYDRAAMDAKFA